ncbi:efflux RND transporter periplasmic adaptor subunit [Acinetobacter sichuanensis]|uniref:Efflux RND transporter periplasmic adaptor subunit n=3 Tax=Acinetobacter TaxID=469 RepID=A0ABV7BK41_9GAMM|nr:MULTISPECIES: efflux RND transporter periplasmic adaptor subunit [Acinetobacter]QXR09176.1 efflux RND transporter periplasmic adaptor subunit [Acinetobacter lwoffii]QXW26158.1 efflux RND transporter periplasmic adaptor subunit [Acinetobacter johnsonii]MBH8252127.1 efflux RND transporter periplasmic adaptor subunit [Acinetobacter baumannii]MCA4442532.1 efflux RND transporter periplasmic adaptor subunit [Acinetobacter baumannii]MCD0192896.1 efflux RND transporter periplasmic adaptor subunit [
MQTCHHLISSILITTVLLIGCTQSKDAEQSAAEMPPVVVSTITVLPQSMNVIENLPGRVTAYRIAEIRPQVGGIVDKVLFKQGSYVQAGQPLFKLNSEIFQADVKSNQATLNRAQAEVTRLQVLLKRYTELVKVNAVSQQEYNNTEADYKKAKADVAQMQAMLSRQQLNLKYATVTAPISGTIGEILVTEGALVGQGDSNAMAVIQQINKVYVDVKQSISDYEKLQEALQQGDVSNIKHTVEILNSQGKPYNVTGEILFSDTKVDPDTGDVTIRILVNNQNQKLLPGMYVRVNMSRAQVENALLVPEQAIQHDINGKANVTIVNQKGLAQSKPIQLGQRYQNSYVVTQGLQAGEKVIVEGADRIQPEQKLKIKQWQPTNTQESGGKK